MSAKLTLHPDRALPCEPRVREVARALYGSTRDLPLVCMHGHVDASLFARNEQFADPAALLITPDHYVTRMLISQGVAPEDLGVARRDGGPVEIDPRAIWRRFCEGWRFFRGTPSRYWLEHELVEVFGVDLVPSTQTADAIFDVVSERLADPAYRPMQLLDRFGIELLATTDPAQSTLAEHRRLAEQGPEQQGHRIIPTFRPDALVQLATPTWRQGIEELAVAADVETGDYAGYLVALRAQRLRFVAAGGLATDHGHLTVDTTPLPESEAAEIYRLARAGEVSPPQAAAFEAHMLFTFAQLATEDGLVMQIHPGVLRDHHLDSFRIYGPDIGFDIPVRTDYTRALQPMLQRFGRDRNFRAILFTVDETSYSRELAPLAGAYPSLRLGAPWWFLDSPDGMRRFRETVTETAGFYNTSGFVDDTRAFASIPARHDLSRRIDAGYLARLVCEHRLTQDEAVETAIDLAYNLPKTSYARRA
ncbi:glucuronate isomerase [Dermatophilaceae bacterium Sec6.4]